MTIPVLKNRLLQLSGRKFREADHGARSFREFLQVYSNLIEVSDSAPPGYVTLRSAAATELPAEASTTPRREIRPDLWNAVLDFSSDDRYVWDSTAGRARVAQQGDADPELPKLSADEFDGWRKDFVASLDSVDEPMSNQLKHWSVKRLPTLALPPPYRRLWNKFLKERVKDRLSAWFADNQLGQIPEDPVKEPTAAGNELQNLREFVVRCVQQMSMAELEQLKISPTVALRVHSK